MKSYLNSKNKQNCSGCHACENICPIGCISMKKDNEGFLYPNIDGDKCVKCNLCLKVCQYEKTNNIVNSYKHVYAMKNRDKNIVSKSSSGGVFIPISDVILSNKGVVCGANFDKDFSVIHSLAYNEFERDKFCTSKYVQSKIGFILKKIKVELDSGKEVIFTGTPCQIDGLKLFLGKEYENLVTVDFICHGVPSPLVYKMHIDRLKKKYNSEIKKLNFREKDEKWGTQNLKIDFTNNKTYYKKGMRDNYYNLFLSDIILRPSCHNCNYAQSNRISDLTIADFWGIENVKPEFSDKKGVSLVIVNSKKGKSIINKIKNQFFVEECELNEVKRFQPNLSKATQPNKNRTKFFDILSKYGYERACLSVVTIPKIINKPKKIIKNLK